MNKSIINTILMIIGMFISASCQNQTQQQTMKTVYDFSVENQKGEMVNLSDYKGKVLLIVNTASRCGFTPQYEELEQMYEEFHSKGFEILDFPCNQFGQQAPETDEEYTQFCQLNYHTAFPRFRKIEVNGENEIALYTWLKEQKGFAGFDPNHPLTAILDKMFTQADSAYASKPSIKWNFTKFLIDAEGNVVERFEPTATKEVISPAIKQLLK